MRESIALINCHLTFITYYLLTYNTYYISFDQTLRLLLLWVVLVDCVLGGTTSSSDSSLSACRRTPPHFHPMHSWFPNIWHHVFSCDLALLVQEWDRRTGHHRSVSGGMECRELVCRSFADDWLHFDRLAYSACIDAS